MKSKLLYIFIISIGFGENPDSLFKRGTEHLEKGNYIMAVNDFESILKQGLSHKNLYYNLGNSYYRSGNYGQAIWAYEKGLEINPIDKDIEFNLSIANSHIKDRIHIPEVFFLLKWYRMIKKYFTFSKLLSISSLFILLGSLYYLITKLFNFGFTSFPIQLFLFLSVIFHGILIDKYLDEIHKSEGIVIQNQVQVFSGPFVRSDAVIFKIHEGIKISIDSEQGDWAEISLLDGKKGWIKSNQLRVL